MKRRIFIFAPLLLLIALCVIAAKPAGITQLTSLWVGDPAQTATVTPGDNDAYIYGTLEVDGAAYFDGGVTLTDTNGLTAPRTAELTIPLLSAYVNGAGLISTATTPDAPATAVDGLPVIVYAASSETTSIGYTVMLPYDYSSGLSFRIMISSDSSVSYTSLGLDWAVFVNNGSTAFGTGSPEAQVMNSEASPSAKNAILTFTVADAGTISLLSAGTTVTAYFWNQDGRSGASKTNEIKAIGARYTAAR